MTKKRLSDLLREEVNLVNSDDTSLTDETPTSDRSNRSRLIKAQLEAQIDELTTAFEAAQQEIASLQAQIAQLEEASRQQEVLVNSLQIELETAKMAQGEGETQELVNHLQTELAEQAKLVEKLYAELQKAEDAQIETKLTPTPPTPSELAAKPYSKGARPGLQLVNRYVAPLQSTSDLSNEDIGWFD